MANIRVNENGCRIGDSHQNAKLSDKEVDDLLADREAGMSLSALAAKWGISKSGAKAIVDGKRRAQIGMRVERSQGRAPKVKKVRVKLSIPLHHRARLHRLGGAKWLMEKLEEEAKRAR